MPPKSRLMISHHSMGYLPVRDRGQPAPRHPEELDGQQEAAYGDDDENGRFRNSDCPYIRYAACNTFTHVDGSQAGPWQRRTSPPMTNMIQVEVVLGSFH